MSDWLFDGEGEGQGEGEPDAETARIASALARYRRKERPLALPKRPFSPRIVTAACVVAAACIGLATWIPRADDYRDERPSAASPYSIEPIAGRVDVVDARGRAIERGSSSRDPDGAGDEDPTSDSLPPGSTVSCGADGRARVRVTGVGSVVLEENSRLRIDPASEHSDDAGYMVHLDRGTLRATIFAAPRLFQVGTPSGIAVDLGCIYSASVRDDGSTLLAVDTGAVSFEADGRKVYVPSGAECVATPSHGPSTPVWTDESEERKRDVLALDGAADPSQALLESVLAPGDERATLTLFHLLDHSSERVRRAALARIAEIAPDAAPFDDALTTGDADAREALRDRLNWR